MWLLLPWLEVFYFKCLAGPEIAVASTKAYTAQICLLFLLAKISNDKIDTENEH